MRALLPVKVGTRRYLVEAPSITRAPLGSIADAQDNQADPSEQSLTNDGLWKRTQEDWSLGAGQRYFDLRTDRRPSVRERFRWSRGLDPFTERRQISLAPLVEEVAVFGAASFIGFCARKGDRVYASQGTSIKYSAANDLDTTWTDGTDSMATGPINSHSVAVVAGDMYIADQTQVLDDSAGLGTFTTVFSSIDTDYLVEASSTRLLGMHDNSLWEFTNTGAKRGSADIFTAEAGFVWRGGLGTDNGVYVWGDDGTNSDVYFLVPVDATGEFPPPYIAWRTPSAGEVVRDMAYFGGVALLVTSRGIRLAQVQGNGTLTSGPLIERTGCRFVLLDGQYAYVTCDDILDADGVKDATGVMVLDLSEFTSTLVPARCDLLVTDTVGTINGIAKLGDRIVVGVNEAGDVSVQASSATKKVATGELRTGGITMGIADKHALSSVELQLDPLPAGSSISVSHYTRPGGTETVLGTLTTDEATEAVFRTTGQFVDEEPELGIDFTRGSTVTDDVVLRRWTLRAAPILRRNEEIVLPIKLYDVVEYDGGRARMEDPLNEWQYLFDLVANRTLVDVEIGSESFKARCEGLFAGPGRQAEAGFDEFAGQGRQWLQGTVSLVLHTLLDDGNY